MEAVAAIPNETPPKGHFCMEEVVNNLEHIRRPFFLLSQHAVQSRRHHFRSVLR